MSVFHFKQFSVKQSPSVFKVNTDGCLLGAFVCQQLSASTQTQKSMLDIGTGTGVIALMLAQCFYGEIEAIDINKSAVDLANENFKASSWSQRLKAIHTDLTSHIQPSKKKYNLIVSNPPFFSNSLQSPSELNNQAKHNDGLPLKMLLDSVQKLLAPNGDFFVILPPTELKNIEEFIQKVGLYILSKLNVAPVAHKAVHRVVLHLSNTLKNPYFEKKLVIQHANGNYTSEYVLLLKAFYLKL